MEKADTPPMDLKKTDRPAWFECTILASLGKRSLHYAGYDWEAVYSYEVHDWNGVGEIVPQQFLMARPPGLAPCTSSAGRVMNQPGMPEFWAATVLGARVLGALRSFESDVG